MYSRNPFAQTPDLSGECNPQPKQYKAKKTPKPIKKIGEKGEANLKAVVALKKEAEQLGITTCEIKLEGCWKSIMNFAHGKKKSKGMTKKELETFAIAACNPCHQKIEYECEAWTGMKMEKFVKKVIKERKK